MQTRFEGPLPEVLRELIQAWRVHRHAAIGDLAEAVGASVGAEARPLVASRRAADLEAWDERERLRNPVDFGALMATARGGGQDHVAAHVRALAAWDDPRFARGLMALLADPPYAGVKSRGMLKVVLEALEATRDPRVPVLARELARRYLQIVHSGTGGWVATELEAIARRMEALPVPQLDAELEAACRALEQRLGPDALAGTRGEARAARARAALATLEAAVYEAPDDDAARLVLADALTEAGDPRGELIVLQMARAHGTATTEQLAREEQIVSDAATLASWAQPLSNAGRCTFERGFVARVVLFSKPARDALAAPAWSTVRALDGLAKWPRALVIETLGRPAFARLRDPGFLAAPMVRALAERGSWPFVALGVQDAHALDEGALRAFSALESLTLNANGDVRPGLLDPLERLRSLAVDLRDGTFTGRLVAHVDVVDLSIQRARLDPASIPRNLERLSLQVPDLDPGPALVGQTKLRTVNLSVRSRSGLREALGGLPALESLALSLGEAPPADLFAETRGLRNLSVSFGGKLGKIPRGLFDTLGALRELDAGFGESEPGALSPLTELEVLLHRMCGNVDEIPEAPALRKLHMVAPPPDGLVRLLARLPRLAHLQLDVRTGTNVSPSALASAIADSSVSRCTFRVGWFEVTIVRDADPSSFSLSFAGTAELPTQVGRGLPLVSSVRSSHSSESDLREVRNALGVQVEPGRKRR